MGSNLGFVVKVMGLSALLAIAIKSVGPLVVVSATPGNIVVLWVVLLPTLALGIALGWRAWQQRSLL